MIRKHISGTNTLKCLPTKRDISRKSQSWSNEEIREMTFVHLSHYTYKGGEQGADDECPVSEVIHFSYIHTAARACKFY